MTVVVVSLVLCGALQGVVWWTQFAATRNTEGIHLRPPHPLPHSLTQPLHHSLTPSLPHSTTHSPTLIDNRFDNSKIIELPALAIDNSELILSSLIERTAESQKLHMTIFLLNTAVAAPHKNKGMKINKIHSNFIDIWTEVIGKMNRIVYTESGLRVNVTYYCKIWNSVNSKSYQVEGVFVSNTGSKDLHMNQRVDILRCPIHHDDVMKNLDGYISSGDSVGVEIIRNSKIIAQYSIPWKYRRSGYLMNPMSAAPIAATGDVDTNMPPTSPILLSGQSAWEGFNRNESSQKVQICVIGLHRAVSDQAIAIRLVEFIEYHILLGVHHIFLALPLLSDSDTFRALTTHLDIYIKSGFISLTATSGDRYFANTDSVLGIQFHPATIDAIWVNSCLYLSKGVADYLGVWNFNDFIVPQPQFDSIISMVEGTLTSRESQHYPISNMSIRDSLTQKCFLLIKAKAQYHHSHDAAEIYLKNDRIIINTVLSFQGGLTSSGACWTGVGGVLDSNQGYVLNFKQNGKIQWSKLSSISDDIVVARFRRSISNLKLRFATGGKTEDVNVPTATSRRGREWKSYKSVFGTLREISEGLDISHVTNSLSKVDRLLLQSNNGYIYNNRSSIPSESKLPNFAVDYSDVALGSVIERKFKSWDLFITTFFLHHDIFQSEDKGILRTNSDVSEKWIRAAQIFAKTQYSRTGIRRNEATKHGAYRCGIRNSGHGSEYYKVKGEFIPSKLSSDIYSHNKLDIFRCKMKHSKENYQLYAGSDQNVEVDILNFNNEVIMSFNIPWKTRRTGYMLSTPIGADSFKPWLAFRRNHSRLPGAIGNAQVYMCVSGLNSPVSQKTLPTYLEFMQHHFLVGVQHIFAAGPYAAGGLMMSNLLMALHPFVQDGLLTINSQSGDNLNFLNSVLGGSLSVGFVKMIYVNMCLYLTKGMVDYLAVWDVNKYFIPQLPHHTIVDIIEATKYPASSTVALHDLENGDSKSSSGRGWADGHNHPFCYLDLEIEEVIVLSDSRSDEQVPFKPW